MSTTRRPAPAGPPRVRRVLRVGAPLAVAAGAAAATLYVASVDPNEPGHYPTCPFLAVTGLFCPGCGALRTIHALAHLDVAAAVSLNALVVAAVPLLAVLWWGWARRRWTGTPRAWLVPGWVLWGLLALVVGFTVLRNVPVFAVLAPCAVSC